jgi:hypothetical protein
MIMTYTLELDKRMEDRVKGYWLYRSCEKIGETPVVDGVYIQRSVIRDHPPGNIRLSLEWDPPSAAKVG